MSKKGETGEQDRGKPQPQKRKIEKLNERIKSPLDLKDRSQDRLKIDIIRKTNLQ